MNPPVTNPADNNITVAVACQRVYMYSTGMNTPDTGTPATDRPEILGDLVLRRRRELGLTQKQVEARSNGFLSQNYISQVERGEVSLPAFDRLDAFAAALNLSVNELKIAAGYPIVTVRVERPTETFDPWLKSIDDLSPKDFERLKAAVQEREERRQRDEHGRS
ncbi:MAG TPA: hypothetical protein DEU95_13870 [Chloroflexi bacterium]|nr:hypothetical protein [Chloroflexota bacterium]